MNTKRRKEIDKNLYIDLPGSVKSIDPEQLEEMCRRMNTKTIINYDGNDRIAKQFIEEGKKYIFADRQGLWENVVNEISPLYYSQIKAAINTMGIIENLGARKAASKLVNASRLILELVLNFSKKGPEYFLVSDDKFNGIAITKSEIRKVLDAVETLKKLNKKLEQSEPAMC